MLGVNFSSEIGYHGIFYLSMFLYVLIMFILWVKNDGEIRAGSRSDMNI